MYLPVPHAHGPERDILNAWRAGRLELPRCESCSQVHWPPQRRCPACAEMCIGAIAARGDATIESFSRVHHVADAGLSPALPFTMGLLRLAEGPRLMGWLLDEPADGWRIGLPVCLRPVTSPDDETLYGMPCFAPLAGTRAGVSAHPHESSQHPAQARPAGRVAASIATAGERHRLRGAAVIRGVGDSEIGRLPERDGLDLCVEAAWRALDDAALAPGEIDALFTAYSTTSPVFVFYGALAEALGIRPAIGLTGNAGGGTAGNLLARAVAAVATGQARHVLVVAGENRLSGMGSQRATQTLAAFCHPLWESPYGLTVPAMYALVAQRYLHRHGLDRRALAPVAVRTRANAALHGGAHKRTPLSIEQVLESRPIAEPLHMLDCCLVSDAAGAFVVSAADHADDRSVWIAGVGEQFTHEHLVAAPDDLLDHGARASAARAFAMAGRRPAEVGVASLYDCFTVTPILLAEALGLAEDGRGHRLWRDDAGGPDSPLAINTHGGMLSHAHAGAAGGLLAINECVRQLRGDLGPRQARRHDVGLAHVEGGVLSNHTTVVLTADRP
ncbi:MAG: OB-fold domain-containing protein [Burkholderiaceae bacterium]